MLVLLLTLHTAMADVVDEAPTDCPNGSYGATGHIGPWCEAGTCSTDAECDDSLSCVPIGLCVETDEYSTGGNRGDSADTGRTYTRYIAHGTCDEQSDCTVGECIIADRCGRDGPIASTCGGCSTQPDDWQAWVFGPGLGLLMLAGLRRSRG